MPSDRSILFARQLARDLRDVLKTDELASTTGIAKSESDRIARRAYETLKRFAEFDQQSKRKAS
jgi:hypothetical protein